MNAEYLHQLYGGDITDHVVRSNAVDFTKVSPVHDSGKDLTKIYSSEVKAKGPIDTTGLVAQNINLNNLFVDRPPDPFQVMLNNTLTKIASEIGLEAEPGVNVKALPDMLAPKDQSQTDIQQAQDNIAAAMAELKALGAI